MAIKSVTGTFTATGQSDGILLGGDYNVSLWGTFSATVKLQRSFDGGTTWLDVSKDADGNAASYTSAVSLIANEPEDGGALIRLNCSAFTSGTVNYRISQ